MGYGAALSSRRPERECGLLVIDPHVGSLDANGLVFSTEHFISVLVSDLVCKFRIIILNILLTFPTTYLFYKATTLNRILSTKIEFRNGFLS